MIFEQSVRREFRQMASSILLVLIAVLLTITLVRMLDRAVSGGIDPGDVLIFLLLSAASSVPQLLVLTAFLAVLLTMTRAFRDQEMAVWFSAGLSLLDWIKPLSRFLAPLLAVSLLFVWIVVPWTVAESERLQAQYSSRDESLQAAAGRFRESAGGRRVFFVGQTGNAGQLVEDLVVIQRGPHERTWVLAASGKLFTDPAGNRFLDLEQGRRFDLSWSADKPDELKAREMGFEHYGLLIRAAPSATPSKPIKAMESQELILRGDSIAVGEMLRRIGQSLPLLLLPFLALGLVASNPRTGRAFHLLAGILIYTTYTSFSTIAEAQVSSGQWSLASGLAAAHGSLALAMIVLLWFRLGITMGLRR